MNEHSRARRSLPPVIGSATGRHPQGHVAWSYPQDRKEPLARVGCGRYKVRTTGVAPAAPASLIESLAEAVMNMRRGSRSRTTTLCGLACMLVMLGTSCSTEPSSPTSSPATASSPTPSAGTTSSSSSPTSAATEAALAAYDGYWVAQIRSQANPAKAQDPNLVRYASGQALAGAQSTLLLFRQNGIAMRGDPIRDPHVTSVDTAARTVAVVDCVDSSNWKPVYVATGKSALAPGQSPRVVVNSTLELSRGVWTVSSSVVHRDQTC